MFLGELLRNPQALPAICLTLGFAPQILMHFHSFVFHFIFQGILLYLTRNLFPSKGNQLPINLTSFFSILECFLSQLDSFNSTHHFKLSQLQSQ